VNVAKLPVLLDPGPLTEVSAQVREPGQLLFTSQGRTAMKQSFVLITGVAALVLLTLAPTTASADGIRTYVGPGPGYGYVDMRGRRGYVPQARDHRPRGYYVYRVPRRDLKHRARRYRY